MDERLSIDQVMAQADAAFLEMQRWQPKWREAWRYLAPERDLSTNHADRQNYVYDSAPIVATNNLVAGLIMGVMPPWSRWFRLVPGKTVTKRDRPEIAKSLYQITDGIIEHMLATNYLPEMNPLWTDVAVPGHGILKVEPSDDGANVRYCNVPVDRAALVKGRYSDPNIVYQKVYYNGYDLMRYPEWKERIDRNPSISKLIKEKLNETHECLVGCFPESSVSLRYRKVVVLKSHNNLVLEDRTIPRSPYHVARWKSLAETPYSYGLGMSVKDDARALNTYQMLAGQLVKMAAGGAWTVTGDLGINPRQLQMQAGLMIPVMSNDERNPPMKRLDIPGDTNITQLGIESKRADIQKLMHDDHVGPLNRTPRSAREIDERDNLIDKALAAPISLIMHEFAVPMIQSTIDVLARTRPELRGVRIDRKEIDVSFLSPIARAVGLEEARTMQQFSMVVAEVGQMDARAYGVLDAPMMLRKIADKVGVDPDIIRNEDDADNYNKDAARGAAMAAQQSGMMPANGQT